MRSGPHLNIKRAAMRPAGRVLDIPALDKWLYPSMFNYTNTCVFSYTNT